MRKVRKILFSNKSLGVLDRFLNQAAPIVIVMLFSKTLSKEQFGLYSLAMSMFLTLTILESFFQTATIRYCATPNKERFEKIISSLVYLKLASCVIACGILLVKDIVASAYKQPALGHIFDWFPAIYCVFTLRSHFVSIIRAKQDIKDLLVQDTIYSVLYVGCSIALMHKITTAEQLFILYFVTLLIPVVYLVCRYPQFLSLKGGFDKPLLKEIFHYGKYTALVGLGGVVYQNFDVMMIGYLSSIENVGVYRIGRISATIVIVVNQGLLLSLLPQISALYEQHKHKEIFKVYAHHVRQVLWFAVPFFILSLLFAEPLFRLYFHDKYAGAGLIFSLFAFSGILRAFNNPQGALLAGVGLIKLDSFQMWVGVALNILFNLILIPKFHFVGAAISTLLTILVCTLMKEYFIRKYYYPQMGNA